MGIQYIVEQGIAVTKRDSAMVVTIMELEKYQAKQENTKSEFAKKVLETGLESQASELQHKQTSGAKRRAARRRWRRRRRPAGGPQCWD